MLAANLATGGEVVRLCDVLKNPSQYKGRELILTAGFRVGFEWQVLVCYECKSVCKTCDNQREQIYDVWVNFEQDVKGAHKLPKVKAFDQLEKVTFRGTFEGPGTYGHLGGYRYQFNVHEVNSAARVWKLHGNETDAPAQVKASVCGRKDGEIGAQP